MGRTLHPESQPDGQAPSLRQVLVPVSKAVTGATSAFGAPSFRYWSRNGRSTSRRNCSAVSASNWIAPSALPSPICWPWDQGPIDQEDPVVRRVLPLERLVHGDGPVDVLLVPEPVDDHHRHGQGPVGEHPVHGLLLPEGVVGRVGQDLPPEAQLLHAAHPPQLPRRSGLEVGVVVVPVRGPPLHLRLPGGLLVVDVRKVDLPEGAVVEPVVALPAVHHGVHGHRHLERRVRVDERHEGEEAVVGDAQDAHPAVRLGDVPDEPLDGVVGVGGVVHRGGVLRPPERPVHHVVPLRPVLPADVLDHADVAALHDHVGDVVVALEHRAEVGAPGVGGELVGLVRGPGEEHGGALRPLRHQDHRVQLHPVPHRDHGLPALVIEARMGGLEGGGDLRRERRRRRGGRAQEEGGTEDQGGRNHGAGCSHGRRRRAIRARRPTPVRPRTPRG